MQKDQLQAGHTIPLSHSEHQASERPPCCHKESAAASWLSLLAREPLKRHWCQLLAFETSSAAAWGSTDPTGLLEVLRLSLRRFLPRFVSIHADIAAELVLASSGMMRPLPRASFLAYNNCAGLTGLGSSLPAVSPSDFLGACSLRNLRQIDIDVL